MLFRNPSANRPSIATPRYFKINGLRAGRLTACGAAMQGLRNDTDRAPCQAAGGFDGWSMTADERACPPLSAIVWQYHSRAGQSDSGLVACELGSVTSPVAS